MNGPTAKSSPAAAGEELITMQNWNLSCGSAPSRVVVARDVAHIQEVVRQSDQYPAPVLAGCEISFSPEIGDATVGSLVSTTSKDSSIDGLGYLSALVYSVTYVDADGNLVTLGRQQKELLARFICSNGMLGIVVEVTLVCRPLKTIATSLRILRVDQRLAARLLDLRSSRSMAWSWYVNIIRAVKYQAFLAGNMSSAIAWLMPLNGFFNFVPAVHYRYEFVNRYPKVTAEQARLDFTFYEFDIGVFKEVVAGMLELCAKFKAETGFTPGGLAMYFVERPGDKPSGSFSGPAGTSFMMDPFTGSPEDPRWHRFLDAANDFAARHGARMSPTQTKRLTPAHCVLDASLAHPRFTTPYYAQFLGRAAGGPKE